MKIGVINVIIYSLLTRAYGIEGSVLSFGKSVIILRVTDVHCIFCGVFFYFHFTKRIFC